MFNFVGVSNEITYSRSFGWISFGGSENIFAAELHNQIIFVVFYHLQEFQTHWMVISFEDLKQEIN